LLLIRLQSLQLRDNRFVDLAQHPLSKVLTEIRQARIIKRTILVEGFQSQEILQIQVLFNMLNQFPVTAMESFLRHQRSQGHAQALRRGLNTSMELLGILRFKLILRNQFRQNHPRIFRFEFPLKRY